MFPLQIIVNRAEQGRDIDQQGTIMDFFLIEVELIYNSISVLGDNIMMQNDHHIKSITIYYHTKQDGFLKYIQVYCYNIFTHTLFNIAL